MKGRCKLRRRYLSLFFCTFLLILIFFSPKNAFSRCNTNVSILSTIEASQNEALNNQDSPGGTELNTTPSSINIQLPDDDSQNLPPDNTNPTNTESQNKKPINMKPPKINPPVKKDNNPLPNGLNNIPKSKNPIENFINNKNLKSKSKFLIWINTSTQRTNIFTKANNIWILSKTFVCATGKDSTPTIKGIFQTKAKASWVYDKKYHCYLKYVTKIYKGYLLHSVILNKYGKVIDGTLGKKKSHGCVRLSIKDSEWIYKNLPLGTTIFIN
jgi:lipoprotein-anchoring transpeptidase ErfK/SrfK